MKDVNVTTVKYYNGWYYKLKFRSDFTYCIFWIRRTWLGARLAKDKNSDSQNSVNDYPFRGFSPEDFIKGCIKKTHKDIDDFIAKEEKNRNLAKLARSKGIKMIAELDKI